MLLVLQLEDTGDCHAPVNPSLLAFIEGGFPIDVKPFWVHCNPLTYLDRVEYICIGMLCHHWFTCSAPSHHLHQF